MTGPPRYVNVGTTVDGLTPHERARRNHLLDRWLIAHTHTHIGLRYPCTCHLGKRCNPKWCPCAGRTDHDTMPAHCCSRPRPAAANPDDLQKAA